MSIHEFDITVDEDYFHDRADTFVASLSCSERITWLKKQGVTDEEILQALLDPQDSQLDEFTREQAHEIASSAANGNVQQLPIWLQ